MVLTDSTPSIDYRLPTDVVPKHYDLTVHTDLENATFDGVARTDLHIVRGTSKIVFNTLDLELSEVTLHLEGHEEVLHESKREFDRVAARGIITFSKTLPAGTSARLSITIEGKLIARLQGQGASQDDSEKVAAFFKDKDTSAYDMQLHQTLHTIKFNVNWIERSTEELKGWLEEHMPA
ncbi:hypothetical protein NUW54_g7815 [Trametes sanguinea]|uniref:Uncharacterized protein n=1 Tax=Trametes sanguinea TaxID=158606 RepID=A0ACC1PHM4_9APHY|nr:hypothetical protein NUW54_g7815 [Trametes sanguinea]